MKTSDEHKWICPHCRQTGVNCAAIQHAPNCQESVTPAAARLGRASDESVRHLAEALKDDVDEDFAVTSRAVMARWILDRLTEAAAAQPPLDLEPIRKRLSELRPEAISLMFPVRTLQTLVAEVERLRSLHATPAGALRALVEQWRELAGPRPLDDTATFPAGHDMTETRYLLHQHADELAALLPARPDAPTKET